MADMNYNNARQAAMSLTEQKETLPPSLPTTRLGPPRGTTRAALQLPRLYRVTVVQSWTIGGQNRCEFCDGRIGHLDLDYEVAGVESEPLHFHSLCYHQSIIEGLCKR
jgi:hypothetical protein